MARRPLFRIHLVAIVLGLLIVALPALASAQTPRIQSQGAAAAGMGNAFAAQADDPSALHYNAAGMTQLSGVQMMLGTTLIGGTTDFTGPAGATTGNRGGVIAIPPPSHFYLTANLKSLGLTSLDNVTIGLGANSPFGSQSRYPENSPFRSASTFSTLPLIDIKPTVAIKLNEQLSIGVGLDIYTFSSMFGHGQVELNSISPGAPSPFPAGSKIEINGSDTAVGANVSLLYTRLRNEEGKPVLNFGFVYRSETALNLNGDFLVNGTKLANASARFVLPEIMSAAVAYWPVRARDREWKLEFDVDRAKWSSVTDLNVTLSSGSTILNPQKWTPSYTYMFGTEYKWLSPESLRDWDIALRAGYMHQESQVPAQTFLPGIPSARSHTPSVGLGLLCKENGTLFGLRCGNLGPVKAIGLDLTYQAVLYEDRAVAGNLNPTVNGTYSTTVQVGSVSLRFNF